ncbi:NAD(P)-dependent oxidoreductase [Chloroflexota bacterium]
MNSVKVGFIGLGNMGMIMARKLVENGLSVTVYDLRKEAVEEMKSLGAVAAKSCREVAETSDVIISMVRDIPQTEEVIFGKDGVWEGIEEGNTIILSSSISPEYCRELYARAKEKGIRVIDAAVSTESRSFTPGQEWSELTLMVGGDEDTVKQCWPVFEAMAKNTIHLGSIGMGQACKLVNNLAMYGNSNVARECLNLGLKAGLNLEKMAEAMSLSTGNSRGLRGVIRWMRQPPAPAARVPSAEAPPQDLGTKDRELAMEMARTAGANTPLTSLMAELDLKTVYDAYSALIRK